jgi:hypothetical protein
MQETNKGLQYKTFRKAFVSKLVHFCCSITSVCLGVILIPVNMQSDENQSSQSNISKKCKTPEFIPPSMTRELGNEIHTYYKEPLL